jgi:prepilin-type N-terminal cleavage/methylation domain-containing protein
MPVYFCYFSWFWTRNQILKIIFRGHKKMKKRGFTLVELMVVIAIIIILAAIAIPSYINMTKRAKKASITSNMAVLATGLQTYYLDWGHYPVSTLEVNVAKVSDAFYTSIGGSDQSPGGGKGPYISTGTFSSMYNPFYPGAVDNNGIMYVSNDDGTHYSLFAPAPK